MNFPYGISERGAKIAAGRLRTTVEDYLTRLRAGLLWCSCCRDWLPVEQFPGTPSRKTGRSNRCRPHVKIQSREKRRRDAGGAR